MPIDLEERTGDAHRCRFPHGRPDALVQVCSARGEHEITDYAQAWNIAAGRLERCVASIERLGL
jgi:hypothetical protein